MSTPKLTNQHKSKSGEICGNIKFYNQQKEKAKIRKRCLMVIGWER